MLRFIKGNLNAKITELCCKIKIIFAMKEPVAQSFNTMMSRELLALPHPHIIFQVCDYLDEMLKKYFFIED